MSDKAIRLDSRGWSQLVLNKYAAELEDDATHINEGYLDPLVKPILDATQVGWSTLETGSGWGTLSAMLARQGRHTTIMDWSHEIATYGNHLFRNCGLDVNCACADLFSALPFRNKSFECVWSSGVLEHFERPEQLRIIRESVRIARHIVISLVPNNWSIAYRLGKWHMERSGTWDFGYEHPVHTQRDLFVAAGLSNIRETTVDASRSGWFLAGFRGAYRLQRVWNRLCNAWPKGINTVARQGYMLVTIGEIL